jgi:PAS domain S-box-containing protein
MSFDNQVYDVLYSSIQEGLIVVDEKGKIIKSNPACCKLFELSDKDLEGESIQKIFPGNEIVNLIQNRFETFNDPSIRIVKFSRTVKGVKKGNIFFVVEIRLNPFRDSVNDNNYMVILVSDVTSKKYYENKLLEYSQSLERKVDQRTKELWKSQQLYKSIAKNFPDGIILILDKDRKCIFAEGQGLIELNAREIKILSNGYLNRFTLESQIILTERINEAFNGDSNLTEVMIDNADFEISMIPLVDNDQKIDQILIFEKDITRQKEFSKQLQENLEKEKELNELKSRFVSMASHEFRTPLTTIKSSAGLIEKYISKNQPEHSIKHVERIRSSVKNLTSILNDFLSIEKLESGKVHVELQKVNLHDLIHEVQEEMENYKKNGQHIEIIGNSDLEFQTDVHIFKNILINLVSNAIKYSHENQAIQLSYKMEQSWLILKVIDTGIGIPEKEQQNMFGRFFRAGNVTNIEGTGLGLSIVKRYLTLLNANIGFESTEGKGTTFTLKFNISNKNG